MSRTLQNALEPLMIGLGLTTPLRRFAAFSILSGGFLTMIQPASMFVDGVPRPWSLMKQSENDLAEPTPVPWWLAAGASGFLTATFL